MVRRIHLLRRGARIRVLGPFQKRNLFPSHYERHVTASSILSSRLAISVVTDQRLAGVASHFSDQSISTSSNYNHAHLRFCAVGSFIFSRKEKVHRSVSNALEKYVASQDRGRKPFFNFGCQSAVCTLTDKDRYRLRPSQKCAPPIGKKHSDML